MLDYLVTLKKGIFVYTSQGMSFITGFWTTKFHLGNEKIVVSITQIWTTLGESSSMAKSWKINPVEMEIDKDNILSTQSFNRREE